jgi:hypothetical protein
MSSYIFILIERHVARVAAIISDTEISLGQPEEINIACNGKRQVG